jgi:ribosomal protein S18 acetylase RimI-like enzyme
MNQFEVKRLNNLSHNNITHLVEESKNNGFRFLQRLVEEYKNGSNTFKKPGEALFGVFNKDGKLIAIGGLNVDPFSKDHRIGRVRRFHVSIDYRRVGLGSLLLDKIITHAKNHFDILVLHTDTEQADKFYTAYGFSKTNNYPNSTHLLDLSND